MIYVNKNRPLEPVTQECPFNEQLLQRLLDKYKIREERELMNTDLDQGDVLKDASVGVSGAAESGAESSPSTRTSRIIKVNDLTVTLW